MTPLSLSEEAGVVGLSEVEMTVLDHLFHHTHSYGEFCTNFKTISSDTGLDIASIRKAALALRQAGFAEFWRGLMSDDGEVAGSGYCITTAGREHMEPIIEAREALSKYSPISREGADQP